MGDRRDRMQLKISEYQILFTGLDFYSLFIIFRKEINAASQNGKRAALQSIIKSKLATKRKAVEEAPGPSTSSTSTAPPCS